MTKIHRKGKIVRLALHLLWNFFGWEFDFSARREEQWTRSWTRLAPTGSTRRPTRRSPPSAMTSTWALPPLPQELGFRFILAWEFHLLLFLVNFFTDLYLILMLLMFLTIKMKFCVVYQWNLEKRLVVWDFWFQLGLSFLFLSFLKIIFF